MKKEVEKLLVFDVWGNFAHFKKIYATTSALSYPIPMKTNLIGLIYAINGELNNSQDDYLEFFQNESSAIAVQIINPIRMQRYNINLRPTINRYINNHKPTTMEFVYRPWYRIFFWHEDKDFYNKLKERLKTHQTFYTIVLGISNLIGNFEYIGDFETKEKTHEENVMVHSVIPSHKFIKFDEDKLFKNQNEVIEISQCAHEMDLDRNVTKRGDLIFDRKTQPIVASVKEYLQLQINSDLVNVIPI